MTKTCEVSGDDCLAPAGYQVGGMGGGIIQGTKPARATCFACGLPVCSNCSTFREWARFGRKRVCDECRRMVEKGVDDG